MTHWADNYASAVGRTPGPGRITYDTSESVTETRPGMKTAVKVPSKKTNNQASFGGSLLKNNMEVEAAMKLRQHLRASMNPVCTKFTPFMYEGFWGLHQVYPSLLFEKKFT